MIQRGNIRQFENTAVEEIQGADQLRTATTNAFTIADQFARLKQQEIETNIAKNLSFANVSMQEANAQLKLKYRNDPTNPEFVNEQSQIAEEIKKTYGEQFNNIGSVQWNKSFDTLTNKYHVANATWAIDQQQVNIKDNLVAIKDASILSSAQYGANNDLRGFLTFVEGTQGTIGMAVDTTMGAAKAGMFKQALNADMTTSYISGLTTSDPMKALEALDTSEIQNLIKDPTVIQKLKDASIASAQKQLKNDSFVNSVKEIETAGALAQKAFRGEATIGEIEQVFAENPNMSEKTKDLIRINSGVTERQTDQDVDKLTPLQKAEVYAAYEYKGLSILSGDKYAIDKPMNIARYDWAKNKNINQKYAGYFKNVDSNINSMIGNIRAYQEELLDGYDKKHLSLTDVEKLTQNYISPALDYLAGNMHELEEKGSDGNMLGFGQIKEYMYQSGLKDTGDFWDDIAAANSSQKLDGALMMSKYYEELKNYAKNNKMNSIYNIETLPHTEQIQIYKNAASKAIEYTKRYSSVPSMWFKSEMPMIRDSVMASLSEPIAEKVLGKLAQAHYNPDDNRDIMKLMNEEILNGIAEENRILSSYKIV